MPCASASNRTGSSARGSSTPIRSRTVSLRLFKRPGKATAARPSFGAPHTDERFERRVERRELLCAFTILDASSGESCVVRRAARAALCIIF